MPKKNKKYSHQKDAIPRVSLTVRTYDEKVLKEDIRHLEKKIKVTAQHILSLDIEYTYLLDQITKVEEHIEIWKIDRDFYNSKLKHYMTILEYMETENAEIMENAEIDV